MRLIKWLNEPIPRWVVGVFVACFLMLLSPLLCGEANGQDNFSTELPDVWKPNCSDIIGGSDRDSNYWECDLREKWEVIEGDSIYVEVLGWFRIPGRWTVDTVEVCDTVWTVIPVDSIMIYGNTICWDTPYQVQCGVVTCRDSVVYKKRAPVWE